MDFWQSLVLLMQMMLVWEAPGVKEAPGLHREWNQDIVEMVDVDRKVAAKGILFDPETDAVILGGIRWYESRLRKEPKDGDCYTRMIYPPKDKHLELRKKDPNWLLPKWSIKKVTRCPAKGPMQISYNTRQAVPAYAEVREIFDGIKPWKKQFENGTNQWKLTPLLTEDEFKNPEINVRLGYGILWHWKNESSKGLPADEIRQAPLGAWLTAWGWGKLSPVNWKTVRYVDKEGVRRCAVITAMLEKLNKKPSNWFCGHEQKKIRNGHDRKLVKAIGNFEIEK